MVSLIRTISVGTGRDGLLLFFVYSFASVSSGFCYMRLSN